MADPVSLAAGILSFLKATQTIVNLTKVTLKYRKELEPLIRELERIEAVVATVSDKPLDPGVLTAYRSDSNNSETSSYSNLAKLFAKDLQETEHKIAQVRTLLSKVAAVRLDQSGDEQDDEGQDPDGIEEDQDTRMPGFGPLKRASVVKRITKIRRYTTDLASLRERLSEVVQLYN